MAAFVDRTVNLPVETLCRIFSFVRDDNPIPRPGRTWVPSLPIDISATEASDLRRLAYIEVLLTAPHHRLAWISDITYVCSRWRSVAVTDDSLWSHPTIYLGLHWFNEMLRRSGNYPISLSSRECGLELWHPPSAIYLGELFVQVVLAQRRKIRSLEFWDNTGLVFLLRFMRLDDVEEFKIHVDYAGNFLGHPLIPPPTEILNLFGGHAPHLRALRITHKELRYDQLPPNSSIWSHLRELELSLSGPLLPREIDCAIFKILDRARMLHSLSLNATCRHYCGHGGEPSPECGTCTEHSFQPITTSTVLDRFELYGCPPMGRHLLTHLHLPPTTKVLVHSVDQSLAG